MGLPGLGAQVARRSGDSPVRRTAAAASPAASPNRRKVVVTAAPAEPSHPQQQQAARESSDQESGEPPASQSYGDPDAKGLSQLSDLADLGTDPGPGASQYKAPTAVQMAINSQSQEDVEICNPLPSQPDIPVPDGPDGPPPTTSEPAIEPAPAPGQHLAVPRLPHPADDENGLRVKQLIDSIRNPTAQTMVPQYTYVGAPRVGSGGSSGVDEELVHPKSKATRRGPMDEMRQLVRILVKVIPQSMNLVSAGPEGGGNNRISEDQIKSYLAHTLGDAPYPQWGVPQGWGNYLADLLSWASGRLITKADAMRCARREPGRSWQAIPTELIRLGVFPEQWQLPLNSMQLRGLGGGGGGAGATAVSRLLTGDGGPSATAGVKRQSEATGLTPPAKRRTASAPEAKLASWLASARTLAEGRPAAEVWQHVADMIRLAKRLPGITPVSDLQAVRALQLDIRMLIGDIVATDGIQLPSSELPIAGLEAGPSVSLPIVSGGSAGVSLPGLTQEHINFYASQTGKEMRLHVEKDGKQYAMVPPEEAAAAVQLFQEFGVKHAAAMAAQQSQPMQNASLNLMQNSSLNGSLGPIPTAFGTESQSHISPHAQLDTQASQGGFQDARAAIGGLKPGSPDQKDSKRLSFHNHPDLRVGGETVPTAAVLEPNSQAVSTESDVLVHLKPHGKVSAACLALDAPASSGAPASLHLSQIGSQGSAGGPLPPRSTAAAPGPSRLSVPVSG